jgi:hypothetical protein
MAKDDLRYEDDDDDYDDYDDDKFSSYDDDDEDEDESLSKPSGFGVKPFGSGGSGGLPGSGSRFGNNSSGSSSSGSGSSFGSRPGGSSFGSGSSPSSSGSSSSGSGSSFGNRPSPFSGGSSSGSSSSGGSSFTPNKPATGNLGGSSSSGSSSSGGGFNRPAGSSTFGGGSSSSGSSSSGGGSSFGGNKPPGSSTFGGGSSSSSSSSSGGGSSFGGNKPPGSSTFGGGSSSSSSSSSGGGSSFGGNKPAGSSSFGGGSSSGSSSSGGGSSFGGNKPAGSSSFGGGSSSGSSSSGGGSSFGGNKPAGGSSFGAQSAQAKPDDKKDPKKDDKPASGGFLSGIKSPFGGGSKPDDKKDPKKDDKPAGGGLLGGIKSPFGGGSKPDDKKDPKKDDKPAGGGLLGGFKSPFGGGSKPDDKKDPKKDDKPAGGGLLGGFKSPFGGGSKPEDKKDDKPSSSSSSSSSSASPFGNRPSTPSSPSSSSSSSSSSSFGSTTSAPKPSPFGQQSTSSTSTKAEAKTANASSGSGILGRIGGFFGRGQQEQKPPSRAKTSTSKVPTVAEDGGLTLDNWLDILGIALLFGSLMIALSALSANSGFIFGVLLFFGQLLGWGAIAVPVVMLVVGIWLIIRQFGDKAPTIDPIRLVGVVIAFVAILVALQYVDSLSYPADVDNIPGMLEARIQFSWETLQDGGGAIGGTIYYWLVNNFTEIGGIFIIGFMFVIAALLMSRSSASDVLTRGVGVARQTRASIQQRAIAQRAQRALIAQQREEERQRQLASQPGVLETVATVAAVGAVSNVVNTPAPETTAPVGIRFNIGGTTSQPVSAQSAPAPVAPVPLASASFPPPPATPPAQASSGGLFSRPTGAGIFNRFSKPNEKAPEPPPLTSPLPLDDVPMPSTSSSVSLNPTQPLQPAQSVPNPASETSRPIGSFFSPLEQAERDRGANPAPSVSPSTVASAVSGSTSTSFGSPTSTPTTSTPNTGTGFGNLVSKPSTVDSSVFGGNKFSALDKDEEFDDLLDDEDFDDEEFDAAVPAKPTPSSPFAARTDRLNELRGGQTNFPPSTSATPVTPTPTPVPAPQPEQPAFGGNVPSTAAANLSRPSDAEFPTKQAPMFTGSSGVGYTPPSQLPSAQTSNQPYQQSLSAPVSSGVIRQSIIQWKPPDYRTLLSSGSEQEFDRELLLRQAKMIEDTLNSFGAPGRVVEVNTGPVITQFGVEPDYVNARGKKQRVKVGAIAALDKDLQLALGAKSIRVEAPVPGKGYVGVEVPNKEPATVRLRDVMESPAFQKHKSPLAITLGQSVSGAPISADLASMPHCLIAGTTGSGKSVCVNAIITSLIARNSPDTVKFIMVDPKRVELTGYNGIPHLVAPVVVELERIVGVLKWVTREMDDRYKKFSDAGARNIEDYNKHIDMTVTEKMPYIVVIIDELADLMMLAPEETERTITRIAALARATGIHLVIATQRPSVDVVTGLIKANFPTRIAFAVAGGVDSRVILDQPGAERLLGRGDMLYLSGDSPAPMRLQGVYVDDMEIQNIVRYWKMQAVGLPESKPITSMLPSVALEEPPKEVMPRGERVKQQAFWDAGAPRTNFDSLPSERSGDPLPDEVLTGDNGEEDEMYEQAVELVRRLDKASVSLLQRRLRIGYTRAARLIDVMEARGVIGPAKDGSSKPRDVLQLKT